jgi:hypothetical protein
MLRHFNGATSHLWRQHQRRRAQRQRNQSVALLVFGVSRARPVGLTALTLSCAAGGRAATRMAAGWLPRLRPTPRHACATTMTPRRYCSAQALQRRTKAGPRQLQRGVSQPLWRNALRLPLSYFRGRDNEPDLSDEGTGEEMRAGVRRMGDRTA